jgi:hypothetical protein
MSLFSKSYTKAFPFASRIRVPQTEALSSYYIARTMASATATTKPPLPPFTAETAQVKVKAAQDLWNTRFVQLNCSHFAFLRFCSKALDGTCG